MYHFWFIKRVGMSQDGHLANSTFVNMKERERFIIAPFTVRPGVSLCLWWQYACHAACSPHWLPAWQRLLLPPAAGNCFPLLQAIIPNCRLLTDQQLQTSCQCRYCCFLLLQEPYPARLQLSLVCSQRLPATSAGANCHQRGGNHAGARGLRGGAGHRLQPAGGLPQHRQGA